MIASDDAFSYVTAHGQLADHNHETNKNGQKQICDEEGEAAGFAHLVWEAPDVSEANGGAYGSQDKSQVAAPTVSFVFHKIPSFSIRILF